jgi:hypothetical protein
MAARSGGARTRTFPWPAVEHVRFGWATSRRSGGTILRVVLGDYPHQSPRTRSMSERLEDLIFLPLQSNLGKRMLIRNLLLPLRGRLELMCAARSSYRYGASVCGPE